MDCNLTATQSYLRLFCHSLGNKIGRGRIMQVDLVVKSTSVLSLLLLIIEVITPQKIRIIA